MSNIVKIGNRYYDFGTKNESFLLTAQELKVLGVKNWYFMLEVKRPDLGVQDIDPYDPNITAEQIGRCAGEGKRNPWYFFREVSRVPVRGMGTKQLYLHRAGCAAIWSYLHSIDFELVQPRQTYKTTVLIAIMSYMLLFEYQNCDIPFLHKTEKRCRDNIGILRDYVYALPKWMNPWATMKHQPGLESLKYDKHNVGIAVITAPKSESSAEDKPRGFSLFTWFADECEFVPYMKAVMNGANSTIVQARLTAKANGFRSCMMYASTPGNLETREGKDWASILDEMETFDELKYYDMTDAELERVKSLPGPDDPDPNRAPLTMFYIEFNWKQLRKTEEWLRQQYFEAIKKKEISEYRRGVLLQRYRGDDDALFDQRDIDYITQHQREPDVTIELREKYPLQIYLHNIRRPDITSKMQYFDTSIPYMIGIDPASGKGGDNTAIVIVHPYTFQVVGELVTPYMSPMDLMRVITDLAKMIPRGIFIVETNSIGSVIVDFVQETNMAHRFYHDPKLDASKNPITKEPVKEMLKRQALEKGYIGTYLTNTIREKMFQLLKAQMHDHREVMTSKNLVYDITNLIRGKNGKIEAAPGLHDDLVMAYNHVLYIYYYGYRLERFGIFKEKSILETGHDVAHEYDEYVAEQQVNNIVPYANPRAFENYRLREMLTNDPMGMFTGPGGRDEYGYKRSDYSGGEPTAAIEDDSSLSDSDYKLFAMANGLYERY